MSETKIVFDDTRTRVPAECGCELVGSTAVNLCSLHASTYDLLAALKGMRDTHGTHEPCEQNNCKSCWLAYDKAQAAIAKAKG